MVLRRGFGGFSFSSGFGFGRIFRFVVIFVFGVRFKMDWFCLGMMLFCFLFVLNVVSVVMWLWVIFLFRWFFTTVRFFWALWVNFLIMLCVLVDVLNNVLLGLCDCMIFFLILIVSCWSWIVCLIIFIIFSVSYSFSSFVDIENFSRMIVINKFLSKNIEMMINDIKYGIVVVLYE